jgi:hypothetical protein
VPVREFHRREGKLLDSFFGFTLRLGGAAQFGGHSGRKDAALWKRAEKPPPARIAAIGWKTKPPFQREAGPLIHALARNQFQIKISALGAMGVGTEDKRDSPGIEAEIAGVAAPGFQPSQRAQEILDAASMRSVAIGAAALRTNHRQVIAPGRAEYRNFSARARNTQHLQFYGGCRIPGLRLRNAPLH